MITTETVQITVEKVVAITCSRCKKTVTPDDFPEWDELIEIPISGGYGSVFGDGAEGKVHLCQHCGKDLLGEFIEWKEEPLEDEED